MLRAGPSVDAELVGEPLADETPVALASWETRDGFAAVEVLDRFQRVDRPNTVIFRPTGWIAARHLEIQTPDGLEVMFMSETEYFTQRWLVDSRRLRIRSSDNDVAETNPVFQEALRAAGLSDEDIARCRRCAYYNSPARS